MVATSKKTRCISDTNVSQSCLDEQYLFVMRTKIKTKIHREGNVPNYLKEVVFLLWLLATVNTKEIKNKDIGKNL
jgi:hypothetical protein